MWSSVQARDVLHIYDSSHEIYLILDLPLFILDLPLFILDLPLFILDLPLLIPDLPLLLPYPRSGRLRVPCSTSDRVVEVVHPSPHQVHAQGLRHIRTDRRINEWKTPGRRKILHAASNEKQVGVTVSAQVIGGILSIEQGLIEQG